MGIKPFNFKLVGLVFSKPNTRIILNLCRSKRGSGEKRACLIRLPSSKVQLIFSNQAICMENPNNSSPDLIPETTVRESISSSISYFLFKISSERFLSYSLISIFSDFLLNMSTTTMLSRTILESRVENRKFYCFSMFS